MDIMRHILAVCCEDNDKYVKFYMITDYFTSRR